MSSEESRTTNSSRLSQFGLYRTIDARTEEFLKLSRKRQIRQGCACAAVSTAITVTVVVTILLIYEYSINLDTRAAHEQIRRSNWFGLFNVSSFDAKYNNKLNIDPTTLKLLPIILKALNHNRSLRKLIEDSSSSPIFDKKDDTQSHERNVDAHANMKRGLTSKAKAMEYKSSPVTYYKSPLDTLDDYTKQKKIREYQRIINYFDKMINDKVTGLKLPTIYEYITDEDAVNNARVRTANSKMTNKYAEVMNADDPKLISPQKNTSNCRCPKNLGILLTKLMASIKDALPELLKAKFLCKENIYISTTPNITTPVVTTTAISKVTLSTVTNYVSKSIPVTDKTMIGMKSSVLKSKLTTTSTKNQQTTQKTLYVANKQKTYLTTTNGFHSTSKNWGITTNNRFVIKNINTHTNLLSNVFEGIVKRCNNSIEQNIEHTTHQTEGDYLKQNDSKTPGVTTTFKAYIEAPDTAEYLRQFITKPMLTPTRHVAKVIVSTSEPNKKVKIAETFNKTVTQVTKSSTMSENVDKNIVSDYDIYGLGQITNIFQSRSNEFKPKIQDVITTTETLFDVNIKDLKLFSLKTMGDLVLPDFKRYDNIIKMSETETQSENAQYNSTTETNTETTTLQDNKKLLEDVKSATANDLLIEEQKRYEETITKKPPLHFDKYESNFIKYSPSRSDVSGTKTESPIHDDIESKENNPKILKSMLPLSRPTYLEIHRNHDWKPDDNQDYINLDLYDSLM